MANVVKRDELVYNRETGRLIKRILWGGGARKFPPIDGD